MSFPHPENMPTMLDAVPIWAWAASASSKVEEATGVEAESVARSKAVQPENMP